MRHDIGERIIFNISIYNVPKILDIVSVKSAEEKRFHFSIGFYIEHYY